MSAQLSQLAAPGQPRCLYHGSGFEQTELKPGFIHTGKAVIWDKYESNTYLYATACKESAEILGISSAIEKKYDLKHTHFDRDTKIIKLVFYKNPPTLAELMKIPVWLYKIRFVPGVWARCNNPYNNIDDEWKCRATIAAVDIDERVRLDVAEVLKDYTFQIS